MSTLSEHKPLHFPTQRPNEHVILMLRRHWTVLARDVTQLVLSLILPPSVFALLYVFSGFTIEPGTALYVIVVEVLSLYYLFSFLAYFHDFIDYHLDIWVLTDQRVVSIEQNGLFKRTVSELNLLRVQDVTSEVHGKVQTFLDYGQVHIQTAGESQRFVFEQVAHPSEVAKIVLQAHDRAVRDEQIRQLREASQYTGVTPGVGAGTPMASPQMAGGMQVQTGPHVPAGTHRTAAGTTTITPPEPPRTQ